MPSIPQQFFTPQSMATLSAASGATYLVSNGLQAAFGFNPKWLALVIAQVISLYGTVVNPHLASDYFVSTINGFLIYSTAVGVNAMTANRRRRRSMGANPLGAENTQNYGRPGFFEAWF